ncbi:MAG: ATP-binding protein [Ruminiclostridium sp.]|nr:ATP-binding protein [Ruminiclostridium sp.]
MRDRFYSIRFRSWLMYISFALLIIGFLYVFQVLMLPGYYEYMKKIETAEVVSQINDAWYNDPKNLSSTVNKIAHSKKIYIEISDVNRVLVRANSLDKNNKEMFELIKNLDKDKMEKFISGKDVFFTATTPRSDKDSKAIIMTAQIADENYESEYIHATGAVRVYVFNYLEPIGNTVQIINSQLTLVAFAIIIGAFILSIFFSSSVTRPIVQISKSALRLPQGKFHMEIKKHQFTEIKELTETLNLASSEIAKTDGLQKELMANISHDLRTPLTMIKAYAEMVRDLSGDNPEKRAKHLQVIIDETDRLSSLVTDILDLSKLQSGVAEMNYEVFDFSAHLEDLVSRFTLLNEIKDYKVLLDAEPKIMINADVTKIEQVVYNFINNAITYTGEDKTVRIRLYRKEKGVARFEVSDSGIGIDEENLKYVWDRYYRVKKDGETHARAKKGSGLGLSIVKGVLEMHNFSFGVESEQGKGSTFWFEFTESVEKSTKTPRKNQ